MNTKLNSMKQKLISKDWIFQGTVFEQYKQCGKKSCRCYEDKKHRHGPYWIWTRKENGTTITKTLSPVQARMAKKSIKNMKEVNQLIGKWKKLSIQNLDNI